MMRTWGADEETEYNHGQVVKLKLDRKSWNRVGKRNSELGCNHLLPIVMHQRISSCTMLRISLLASALHSARRFRSPTRVRTPSVTPPLPPC
jgi:hypothetical protein